MRLVPIRQVQYADLDGDGEVEILALGHINGQTALTAIDVKTGRSLWSCAGSQHGPETSVCPRSVGPGPLWLMLADGDGQAEIVVPDVGVMPPLSGYRGDAAAFEGRTGKYRWTRPMRPDTKARDGLEQITAAPDLDGDGTRDLITVSTFEGKTPSTTAQAQPEEPERIYVDALSGRDGRPLWWWHFNLPLERGHPCLETAMVGQGP